MPPGWSARQSARELADEALKLAQREGDPWLLTLAHYFEGCLAKREGRRAEADQWLRPAMDGCALCGEKYGVMRMGLARAFLLLDGEPGSARPLLAESLRLAHELGQTRFVLLALAGTASIALNAGAFGPAARLWDTRPCCATAPCVPWMPASRRAWTSSRAAKRGCERWSSPSIWLRLWPRGRLWRWRMPSSWRKRCSKILLPVTAPLASPRRSLLSRFRPPGSSRLQPGCCWAAAACPRPTGRGGRSRHRARPAGRRSR